MSNFCLWDFVGRMADNNENMFPPPGALADALEAECSIRRALLSEGQNHLTRWPNKDAVGVKSVKAMALNPQALLRIAELWCPLTAYPRSVPVALMRDEVRGHFFATQNELSKEPWLQPL